MNLKTRELNLIVAILKFRPQQVLPPLILTRREQGLLLVAAILKFRRTIY
jgi:hypothetical protein